LVPGVPHGGRRQLVEIDTQPPPARPESAQEGAGIPEDLSELEVQSRALVAKQDAELDTLR